MLLRRITEHVKAQNWTAVALDFVIVVVGVFIGIQVANWNDARGNRAAELRYLESLKRDALVSIENLDAMIADMEEQQKAREALYNFNKAPDDEPLPPDIGVLFQAALFYIARIDISQNAFDTLTNSGQIALIGDEQLVTELQSLDSAIDAAMQWQDETVLFTYEFTDPFLVENANMEAVAGASAIGSDDLIPWIKPGVQPPSLSAELKSLQFRNLIIYQASITDGRIESTNALVDQYRKVLSLIEVRQIKIGDG